MFHQTAERVQGFVMALFVRNKRRRDWDLIHALMHERAQHLLLGISAEGMLRFLAHKDVAFIVPREEGSVDFADPVAWKYNPALVEGEHAYRREAWHAQATQRTPIAFHPTHGLGNIQGYDLQKLIAAWLQRRLPSGGDHAERSVLEAVNCDERFAEIRQHVGEATVFWSHIQLEDALFQTVNGIFFEEKAGRIRAQNGVETQRYWLDYFCLRQCQSDFDLHIVLGLVRQIGTFVASIDPALLYVERSFCIFEAYAACAYRDTKFLCHVERSVRWVWGHKVCHASCCAEKLKKKPINSEHAQTRDAKDKRKIDEMIVNGTYLYEPISFKKMNSMITKELNRALTPALDASAETVETVTIHMPATAAV